MGAILDVVKILLILVLTFLMLFPMMPFAAKTKKFSTIYALKYEEPHNKKNAWFLLLVLLEGIAIILLLNVVVYLSELIMSISFIKDIVTSVTNKTSATLDFILEIIFAVLLNIIMLYTYSLFKVMLKKWILDPAFGLAKKPKRKKKKSKSKRKKNKKSKDEETEGDDTEQSGDDKEDLDQNDEFDDVAQDVGDEKNDEKSSSEEGEIKRLGKIIYKAFWSLFFEGPELEYAKNWVVNVKKVLQAFVYLVEIIYAVLFLALLSSIFFPLPEFMYNILQNVLQSHDWYLYPFISLILLQEICNVFNTKVKTVEEEKLEEKEKTEKEKEEKIKYNLRHVHLELQKRFDDEHCLRYYPEEATKSTEKYVCTNRLYASSLDFIQTKMESNTGRIVKSYMECLDSVYNDKNVYLCASLYSEFGEYIMLYTYTRLLAGSRMLFILPDKSAMKTLRKYISDALMRLTGTTEDCTWRVYTTGERIDQADILIACAEDFKNDDIVINYPTFFEEICNAVFIDADKFVELQSYLCPIISIRLNKATNDRIRYVFLSQSILRGFDTAILPKYFCIDKVFSYSYANENKEVSITLWNKESAKNVIYNKHAQKLVALETIIAEVAVSYGIDGVKIFTSSHLNKTDKDILAEHNIEINEFYKPTPDVNYMIFSDEKCNLSAALYTSTRFRGAQKSIINILSHPYLLREYFIDRLLSEEYINRSSIIQPAVTEYAEKSKLSFLKIFCEATSANGMNVFEFERKMQEIIALAKSEGDNALCPYCNKELDLVEYNEINVEILAAYLLAALCDSIDTPENESIAKDAKDFFLLIDSPYQDGYTLVKDKRIVFRRVKEIFNRILSCNEMVKLCINDRIIGELDITPARVNLEYVVGQSIVYNNIEYEIGQISQDRKIVYLRSENVTFKNCLDTIFLRRYRIDNEKQIGEDGVFYKTKGNLKEIRVSMRKADFRGETYGFYSLLSDCQTLNFKKGAQGNPNFTQSLIEESARNIKGGKILRVSLISRDLECNDNMRLLLSAVFNEFIKTIFPKAYRTLAICPILEQPFDYSDENKPEEYIDRVKSLYPYIMNTDEVETEKDRIQLLFINDCTQDVGILQWFYDRLGHYMHDFLANIYSYLTWLKFRPKLNHYIYFGEDHLPECYDLENCCKLLEGYNLILSESGVQDYETANTSESQQEVRYCDFCGEMLESGRYTKLDDGREICCKCDRTSVRNEEELKNAELKAREYIAKLAEKSGEMFGVSYVKFFDKKFTKDDLTASKIYYRLNTDNRTIYVQRYMPEESIIRSIIRATIELWQFDNQLQIAYSPAQTEYEELYYLTYIGRIDKAERLKSDLSETLKADVEDIIAYVKGEQLLEETPEEQTEDPNESVDTEYNADEIDEKTSFEYIREKYIEIMNEYNDDDSVVDEVVGLYDPNKIPRFWKRLLKGESLLDGTDELSSEDKDEDVEPIGDEKISDEATNEVAVDDVSEDTDSLDDKNDEVVEDNVIDGDEDYLPEEPVEEHLASDEIDDENIDINTSTEE